MGRASCAGEDSGHVYDNYQAPISFFFNIVVGVRDVTVKEPLARLPVERTESLILRFRVLLGSDGTKEREVVR